MNIFGYTLRKPWVKYVNLEVDISEELHNAVLRSVASEIITEMVTLDLCDDECDAIDFLKKVGRP